MVCPICLDDLDDAGTTMCMPTCNHRVHTWCALQAAQYDVRCPVCRHKDERVSSRSDQESSDVFSQLESIADVHNGNVRRYRQRRARVIGRSNSMRRTRDHANASRRKLHENSKQIDRAWCGIQREAWNTNDTILALRKERTRHQRRYNYHNRKLEDRLNELIGSPPVLSGEWRL